MRRTATLVVAALAAVGATAFALEGATSGGRGGGTRGAARTRVVVGCRSDAGRLVRSGPNSRRAVALSFDDGPSRRYTPRILAILNRLHAHATFFEVGRKIAGREPLMRRILASGDEIGNHSFHHPHDPGYRELATTNRAIRAATGFTPCLFRPPYGALDATTDAAARRADLEIVKWSVDSRDRLHPGAPAIRSWVEDHAHRGSIVLMHDGGRHPQTVAALPGMVRALEARGFGLETITKLLGQRFLYRPSAGAAIGAIRRR